MRRMKVMVMMNAKTLMLTWKTWWGRSGSIWRHWPHIRKPWRFSVLPASSFCINWLIDYWLMVWVVDKWLIIGWLSLWVGWISCFDKWLIINHRIIIIHNNLYYNQSVCQPINRSVSQTRQWCGNGYQLLVVIDQFISIQCMYLLSDN